MHYLIERAAQVLFNCEVHEIWICLDDEKTKGKIWPCNFARAHKRERINEGRCKYIYIYMMMPKYSPVRYTILTLEQPVPENRKVQKTP